MLTLLLLFRPFDQKKEKFPLNSISSWSRKVIKRVWPTLANKLLCKNINWFSFLVCWEVLQRRCRPFVPKTSSWVTSIVGWWALFFFFFFFLVTIWRKGCCKGSEPEQTQFYTSWWWSSDWAELGEGSNCVLDPSDSAICWRNEEASTSEATDLRWKLDKSASWWDRLGRENWIVSVWPLVSVFVVLYWTIISGLRPRESSSFHFSRCFWLRDHCSVCRSCPHSAV